MYGWFLVVLVNKLGFIEFFVVIVGGCIFILRGWKKGRRDNIIKFVRVGVCRIIRLVKDLIKYLVFNFFFYICLFVLCICWRFSWIDKEYMWRFGFWGVYIELEFFYFNYIYIWFWNIFVYLMYKEIYFRFKVKNVVLFSVLIFFN